MRANISILVKNLTSGGAEKQSVLLAKALCKQYNVYYIIFNGVHVHDKYIAMLKSSPEVNIVALKGGVCKRFKSLVMLLKEKDISLIFSYLTGANAVACMAARRAGARAVTGLRNSQLPYLKLVADRILTNSMAACAVSNSHSGRDAFIAKGFREDKIIVIPNCFEPAKRSESCSKGADGIKRIITVGRFVPQKDYTTALRTMARIKQQRSDFKFVIVGYGELEEQIRHTISELGLEDVTEIHINPDNISALLSQADIYISTSLFEGTSNSIMEALDASLPVVCTAVGDNNHLVDEGRNGYLTAVADDETLASRIITLLDDENLRKEMGQHSRRLLEERFSTEAFTDSYRSLIAKLGIAQE